MKRKIKKYGRIRKGKHELVKAHERNYQLKPKFYLTNAEKQRISNKGKDLMETLLYKDKFTIDFAGHPAMNTKHIEFKTGLSKLETDKFLKELKSEGLVSERKKTNEIIRKETDTKKEIKIGTKKDSFWEMTQKGKENYLKKKGG